METEKKTVKLEDGRVATFEIMRVDGVETSRLVGIEKAGKTAEKEKGDDKK